MRSWATVLAVLGLAGCGTDGADGGVTADQIGSCLEARGYEVLVEKYGGLAVFEGVSVRTPTNLATIKVYKPEYAEQSQEEEAALRFNADPAERGRFKRLERSVVAWESVPAAEDDEAVMKCVGGAS